MQVIAVYTRETKALGREDNVEVQAKLGAAYARRLIDAGQWPDIPVRAYCDNDITAADPGTFRPDYDRLLTDIKAGDVAHVVSADQERLTRQLDEWEALCRLLRDAGISEVHGYRDGITPVKLGQTAAGRYKAVAAAEYVEGVKVKVREKHAERAAEGRPSGGRQLGFRHGRNERGEATLVHDPVEADALRFAGDAVLTGWSMASIGREWDKRGIQHVRRRRPRGAPKDTPLTLSDRPWEKDTASLRRVLSKPAIAGYRQVNDELVTATWDPIIDPVKWRQIRAVLNTRRQSIGTDGQSHVVVHTKRPSRRYLLTGGLARCGLCDAPLTAQRRRWKQGALKPYYMCHPAKNGCCKIGILGEPFEEVVQARFLARLNNPLFREALESSDESGRQAEILHELKALDVDAAELGVLWRRKTIGAAGWEAAQRDINGSRSRLEAELAGLAGRAPVVDVGSVSEGWEHLTLDEKRHMLRLFVARVSVAPAVRGRRFDPGRITIEWCAARKPAE